MAFLDRSKLGSLTFASLGAQLDWSQWTKGWPGGGGSRQDRPMLDRSRLGPLTLAGFGHHVDWAPWARHWPWGGDSKSAYTIDDDGSVCAYTSAQVTVENGAVCLTARPTLAADGATAWGMPYVSGLISSFDCFKQTYGYFEVRAKLPRGRGLHPGISLYRNPDLPTIDELDIIETIGTDTRKAYLTLHFGEHDKDVVNQDFRGVDTGAEMVTHGLLWTPETVSWYQNERQIGATIKTPAGQHDPMSFVFNLGVGGKWAGPPDRNALPARMLIEGVRVYALKR